MNTKQILKVPTFHDLTKDLERPASWAIVAIDDTKYWHEDIQKMAKKILSVWFVNLREPTNLCDPQINYPATYLYDVFVEQNELYDEDVYNDGEHFQYINEHTKLEEVIPYYMPQEWFDEMKKEGEDWEESQIEYYKCNHVI